MKLEHVAADGNIIIAGGDVNLGFGEDRAAAVVFPIGDGTTNAESLVGREIELNLLEADLRPANIEPPSGPIILTGLAGVGKTALAVHSAQMAVARGWFPGGAFFVDVNGYNPSPRARVRPERIYGSLLRWLTDDPAPPTVDEQASAYHQRLAELAAQGQGVLLLVDNVGDVDQVRALLPTVGGHVHRVLVTSRETLSTLPGATFELDVLTDSNAVKLIEAVIARNIPSDLRVAEDLAASTRLSRLCDGLPLALRIVAALLEDDPHLGVGVLADELAETNTRLHAFDYNETWAVRAAFDLSYRRLAPSDAKLFRLLSLPPGPDISTEIAAVLTESVVPQVRRSLVRLTQAHLCQQHVSGRWRLHDLLRLYAAELYMDDSKLVRERKDPDLGGDPNWIRTLNHFRLRLSAARNRTGPESTFDAKAGGLFNDSDEALEWVRAERVNLVAAVVASAVTMPEATLDIAIDLGVFLDRDHYLQDWFSIASAVMAVQHSENAGKARSLDLFGGALLAVRRFNEAAIAFSEAAIIFGGIGNRHREGLMFTRLGVALTGVHRLDEAIEAHRQAVSIFRERNDLSEEGQALSNLGYAFSEAHRFDEAVEVCLRDVEICRELGDRFGEMQTLVNVGIALNDGWRFAEAVDVSRQAIVMCRELGTLYGEGLALLNLGNGLAGLRRFDESVEVLLQVLALFREIGDSYQVGSALNDLGSAQTRMRRFDDAIGSIQQALDIFRETGDSHSEALALVRLGEALSGMTQFDNAIDSFRLALPALQAENDIYGEARALDLLGDALAAAGQAPEGRNAWFRARDAYSRAKDFAQARSVFSKLEDVPRRN